MNDWFRSWHGCPTHPKWGVIARNANVPRAVVVGLAWALMDLASRAQDRGSVAGADPTELAAALDVPTDQLVAVMKEMRSISPHTGRARFIDGDGRLIEWDALCPPPSRRRPKRDTAGQVRDKRGRWTVVHRRDIADFDRDRA